MRLRQAHAIIEAAAALEAAELPGSTYGFELAPFDFDDPTALEVAPDDYMDGHADFSEGGDRARPYSIDLKPDPDGHTITVDLRYGYREDAPTLLHESFEMAQDPDEPLAFRSGVGARIAQLVIETVHAHEQKLAG